MAALYLHNSIWGPDTPPDAEPHTRATSFATLQSSDHSHPTQPLLHSSTSESVAYLDLLSHQPTHPNAAGRGAPLGLSFAGDPTTLRERKGAADYTLRRRLRRLKLAIAVLEFLMLCWATYTTVRYFLAYARTASTPALALGAVTTAGTFVLSASALLPPLRTHLLAHWRVPAPALLAARAALRAVASLLLLAPTAANLGYALARRGGPGGCAADVDVVWSACTGGTPLALALVRLVLTLAVLPPFSDSPSSPPPPFLHTPSSRPFFPLFHPIPRLFLSRRSYLLATSPLPPRAHPLVVMRPPISFFSTPLPCLPAFSHIPSAPAHLFSFLLPRFGPHRHRHRFPRPPRRHLFALLFLPRPFLPLRHPSFTPLSLHPPPVLRRAPFHPTSSHFSAPLTVLYIGPHSPRPPVTRYLPSPCHQRRSFRCV
ncbi:hypothetical protein B0H17DRAFT_39737 [Mycena rosella]|uniref:Uncharacterized protein n=1 Tax=Mycena rosella TaxID=1033263 RepID=A0AAD7M6T0_MYCRO|nr:hypothetical protein B0H17DRAFT_39737 [Mycena rosella]